MNKSLAEIGKNSEQIERYIARKVSLLQQEYLDYLQKSKASRILAQLRRSAGKEPGAAPETWAWEFENLPKDLVGTDREISFGEWAVHISLTLYAVHQQSRSEKMYASGSEYDLGCAVRRLASDANQGDSIGYDRMPRRFAAMLTAQSIDELAHYARQLVGQLRAESIPVDYARLARQLYLFQFENYRISICREWDRGYTSCFDTE